MYKLRVQKNTIKHLGKMQNCTNTWKFILNFVQFGACFRC